MVLGSDSPRFALYQDGSVIYRHQNEFRRIQLSESEHAEILRVVERINDPQSFAQYVVAQGTDQPDNFLVLYLADEPVFISIYGALTNANVVQCLPPEIGQAISSLVAFERADAAIWLPEKIEVMLWPYEYAPDESLQWPDRWPGLDDPETIQRGDSYSLFVPASELDELNVFLERRQPRGAVEVGDRKWAIALRYPFPHEEFWMGSNR